MTENEKPITARMFEGWWWVRRFEYDQLQVRIRELEQKLYHEYSVVRHFEKALEDISFAYPPKEGYSAFAGERARSALEGAKRDTEE